MIVTYRRDQNRYVDSAGRLATVTEYGKDFYNCEHEYKDTGRRGETPGPNGKRVSAKALQCSKCQVYTIVEIQQRR